MASRRKRLEAIGKAVLAGRTDAIQARVTGHVSLDPDKHLTINAQRLVGSDFSEKKLESFCAIGSRFLRCSFRNIRIGDAGWGSGKTQSEYVECCFDGAKFRSVAPGNARFVNCSFRDVRIYEFYGTSVEIIDCVFSGRIDNGFLNGTRDRTRVKLFERKTNEIVGNDFSECDLQDFAFRTGIDLQKQKLPIGPQYLYLPNATLALQKGRAAISSWEDPEIRRLASILLDIVQMDLEAGQKQQFLRFASRGQFAVPGERLRRVLTGNDA